MALCGELGVQARSSITDTGTHSGAGLWAAFPPAANDRGDAPATCSSAVPHVSCSRGTSPAAGPGAAKREGLNLRGPCHLCPQVSCVLSCVPSPEGSPHGHCCTPSGRHIAYAQETRGRGRDRTAGTGLGDPARPGAAERGGHDGARLAAGSPPAPGRGRARPEAKRPCKGWAAQVGGM